MLKKVHIFKPSNELSSEKIQTQCSLCTTLIKPNLYAYETRRICQSCQHFDATMKDNNEGGDYNIQKEFDPDTDIPPLQIKKSNIKSTDFAGGDRESSQGINNEVKKCKEDYRELCLKNGIDTIVEYINPNFEESKTTVATNIDDFSKSTCKDEDEEESCDIDPRPVVCPVTICSKIVTIDSFMLHFLFDHSKVSRTTLDDTMPQEVILKSANFSTEIQCVATFILETQKKPNETIKKKMESVTSVRNSKKDNKLLLVLAVRLPTSSVKLPNVKCDSAPIFTRSIHTQTEKINEQYSGITTECPSKSVSDYKSCSSMKCMLQEDEVFLLWLCKLDETERVFSLTILGEDKRRGYCYIGDALHVRDKQDPSLLYDRSECLIVKGSAISRLFDIKGQITVIVSLIG